MYGSGNIQIHALYIQEQIVMKIITGIILGILLIAAAAVVILYSGYISMAATSKPSRIEEKIAEILFERSVERRAPTQKNPYSKDDPAVLADGMDHYEENCVICHGAPGVEASEIGKGLNPPAPLLDDPEILEMSDGEFYWTIQNGIRMTGMPAFGPTHSDDEIWKIVAFVRHLPELTSDEKMALSSAVKEGEGHHHELKEAPEKVKTQTQPTQTQTQTAPHEDDHVHD
jgi:mono/diheme cytochrome c family protein